MKKVMILFLLLRGIVQAAPYVDPDTYFDNWPWSDYSNKTWRTVDSTYKIIHQLWYTCQDRCKAGGRADLPYYQRDFTLNAGEKTNWTYTSWKYWNPGRTNNSEVTYTPHLLLTFVSNVVNAVDKFNYHVPAVPGVSGDAEMLTAYVPVTWDLIRAIQEGVEGAAQYYMVSSKTNDWSATNGISGWTYTMPQLLTDAGYTNSLSSLTTNSHGIITGGNWCWTINETNKIITLQGLDEMAACIAQLELIYRNAVPCSPGFFTDYAAIGPDYYGWGDASSHRHTVSNENIGTTLYSVWPFAWSETSADNFWAAGWEAEESPQENIVYSGSSYIYPQEALPIRFIGAYPSDWPSNGWYGKCTITAIIKVDHNAAPGTNYLFSASTMNRREVTEARANASTITLTNSLEHYMVPQMSLTLTMGSLYSEVGTSNGWEAYEIGGGTVPIKELQERAEDSSTYNTTTNTTVEITTNNCPSNDSWEVIVFGNYMRHSNDLHSVAWVDSVSFTNTINKPSANYVYQTSSNTEYSSMSSLNIETNMEEVTIGEEEAPVYEWVEFLGDYIAHTNTVEISSDGGSEEIGVWCRSFLCAIRTDCTNVWGGQGQAWLYIIGSSNMPAGDGRIGSYEWSTDSTWEFETDLLDGKEIYREFYTNTISYTLPGDITTDGGGQRMLYWNMAEDYATYIPFENTTTARKMWAVGGGFFILRYTFPKRTP